MALQILLIYELWHMTTRSEVRSTEIRASVLSHLPAQFTHDWMKQKHGETLSSLLLLRWKGDSLLTCPTHLTGTVTSAFPVHAHPSLMSLWSHLQNDPERPASATLLLGLRAHYWDLLGLGPHLDYEWESSKRPGMLRLAPIHIQALLWADILYVCSSMRSLVWCKGTTETPALFLNEIFQFIHFTFDMWQKRKDLLIYSFQLR